MKRIAVIIVFVVLITGCASRQLHQWQQSTLYFGLSCQDGSQVELSEWQQFVDTEITSRFPEGFTVVTADGQWQNKKGDIIQEPSRMVIILHTADPQIQYSIEAIRERYKERFDQQSVLLTTQPIRVEF